MTYVYFNLYNWERKAYDKGNLGIYYKDVNTGNWKECPSFLTNNSGKTDGRIACLATQYNTVYGIGTPR
jgi:hypothetical protein